MSEARQSSEALEVVKNYGTVPATVQVVDSETCALANARVLQDDKALKAIHGRLDESKKRARAVWEDWNNLINELCMPWEKDKAWHVQTIKNYQKAERDRVEAEQRSLMEEERKKAEERKLQEALEAEQKGDSKTAEAILQEPVKVVTPVVKPDIPKLDQRKYATTFKARVDDKEKLILFVASQLAKAPFAETKAEASALREWAEALEPNDSFLNRKAKGMGKALDIPGVSAYEQ